VVADNSTEAGPDDGRDAGEAVQHGRQGAMTDSENVEGANVEGANVEGASLHPDAVAVAQDSAAAAGLSLSDWLSRTILNNAGAGSAEGDAHGARTVRRQTPRTR
jgi:hypothetical protein